MSNIKEFRAAVEQDEYAEIPLGEGYTLITDHKGGGFFNPYIVYDEGVENLPNMHTMDELPGEAQEKLDEILEYEILDISEVNNVIYPVFPKLR